MVDWLRFLNNLFNILSKTTVSSCIMWRTRGLRQDRVLFRNRKPSARAHLWRRESTIGWTLPVTAASQAAGRSRNRINTNQEVDSPVARSVRRPRAKFLFFFFYGGNRFFFFIPQIAVSHHWRRSRVLSNYGGFRSFAPTLGDVVYGRIRRSRDEDVERQRRADERKHNPSLPGPANRTAVV